MRNRALLPFTSMAVSLVAIPSLGFLRALLRGRLLRIITNQQPVETGNGRGFRPADVRHALVLLPSAAERLAQINERVGGGLLRRGVLIFQAVLLSLGVHDIQKIGKSPIVTLLCQAQ